MSDLYHFKRWFLFSVVSFFFFMAVGSTYGSVGVALPFMLAEMNWTWTQAGAGFTIMALMTGITALIPAWVIRHFSVAATYLTGGLVMSSGFVLLATCQNLWQFYIAVACLGYGFCSCTSVAAVHLLNNWMPDKRSFAIGAYMTIGGLGGVAGPLFVTGVEAITGSWRVYWWLIAAIIFALTIISAIFIKDSPDKIRNKNEEPEQEDMALGEKVSDQVYKTDTNWTFKEVIRCPQYYVIVAAMTMTLFCTVTMSNWAVVHMGINGITAAFAAAAMSTQALMNALSRAAGGILATRIDPKWLLLSAVCAHVIGMIGLSFANSPLMIALFVIGEGYGFGMCLFATTILLINYFGPKNNPEILGTLNLITTVAMLGPVLAGFAGDAFGGFGIVFQSYAVLLLIIVVAVLFMRPPVKLVDQSIDSHTSLQDAG